VARFVSADACCFSVLSYFGSWRSPGASVPLRVVASIEGHATGGCASHGVMDSIGEGKRPPWRSSPRSRKMHACRQQTCESSSY
jgi:hypothetical protein